MIQNTLAERFISWTNAVKSRRLITQQFPSYAFNNFAHSGVSWLYGEVWPLPASGSVDQFSAPRICSCFLCLIYQKRTNWIWSIREMFITQVDFCSFACGGSRRRMVHLMRIALLSIICTFSPISGLSCQLIFELQFWLKTLWNFGPIAGNLWASNRSGI
jgi:hypothetical protein